MEICYLISIDTKNVEYGIHKFIIILDSECGWICNACNHVKKLLKTIKFYAEV